MGGSRAMGCGRKLLPACAVASRTSVGRMMFDLEKEAEYCYAVFRSDSTAIMNGGLHRVN